MGGRADKEDFIISQANTVGMNECMPHSEPISDAGRPWLKLYTARNHANITSGTNILITSTKLFIWFDRACSRNDTNHRGYWN